MNLAPLIRPALYTACVLAGVKFAFASRPVAVDKARALTEARESVSVTDVLSDIFGGRFDEVAASLTGAAGKAASSARADIDAQVQANVIAGTLGGVAIAAVVDLILLEN